MFVKRAKDSPHSCVQGELFLTKNTECVTGGTMSNVRTAQSILI